MQSLRSRAPRTGAGTRDASLYACPHRHTALTELDGWLVGEDSGRCYPIRRGTPDFRAARTEDEGEASSKLERLNALAPEVGWQAALAEVYGCDEKMWRYIHRTPVFLDLVPLTRDSCVLEIGPGLGQFTGPIAARAAAVYALELSPGQAEFVATRCRQEALDRVRVAIGGDAARLPYLSGSFDAVVCNLVLEWCASRSALGVFHARQQRLLAECARVLRPGGALFLATKNRFALPYLVGKPDEHVDGMRFGNALPRWALWAALRLEGKADVPGLLHSHGELSRMLRRAGFATSESFWAAPEMRFPERYVSIRPEAIRSARREGGFAQGHTRLTRLVMPLLPAPFVRCVMPGLVFLSRTPGSTSEVSGREPTRA